MAQNNELIVKINMQSWKVYFRSIRSLNFPKIGIITADATGFALSIHPATTKEVLKYEVIAGKATAVLVPLAPVNANDRLRIEKARYFRFTIIWSARSWNISLFRLHFDRSAIHTIDYISGFQKYLMPIYFSCGPYYWPPLAYSGFIFDVSHFLSIGLPFSSG